MKNYLIALMCIILLLIAGFIFLNKKNSSVSIVNNTTATDTVSVATTTTETTNVATTTKNFYDAKMKVGFDYLDNFYYKGNLTNYLHPVEWPPQIAVTTGNFSCKNSGGITMPDGVTSSQKIGSSVYCVTKESEGAAGSTFTTYTYKRLVDKKIVSLTFIVRFPQCMNFDEPNTTACKDEEANFDIDKMIDTIFSTVVFK